MNTYPQSTHSIDDTVVSVANEGNTDALIVTGPNPGFVGVKRDDALIAPLIHDNAMMLRRLFPFTAPKPILSNQRTFGVGDRLGIATPGHIRSFESYDALPVLAQQSIRELNLTKRSYADVLDAVTFAVFRENYQRGFGADGDHLKTDEEVEYALSNGFTMITLDCSEYIRNDVLVMDNAGIDALYMPDTKIESLYCEKSFDVEGERIYFSKDMFRKIVLIYGAALNHAAGIYARHIVGKEVDFEISVDETDNPTSPAQHYFIASELVRRGVRFATLAPRFVGEFQKGIDYIGDTRQFERDLFAHAAIARHFGYKLSIHSGSDKFSVFQIIGRLTQGNFHVKTAGTSWLEAMRVVAMTNAALYREIHTFALSVFSRATEYYHVTTDLSNIAPLDMLSDAELPELFEQSDARQLIHLTYGLILGATNTDEKFLFRHRLFQLWREHAELYAEQLEQHISKHLKLLYQGFGQ